MSTTQNNQDERLMAAALRLARRALGRAWPNPAVGCLIVAGEGEGLRILGRGWTQPGGRPHAERVALDEAGDAARGATAYVTLEPCAHHGKTPPCADALAAAGLARVVSALTDPDPRTAGQGHRRLADAGIAVETGIGADEAARINRGHVMRMREGRPFVQLKLAHDRNGAIAAPGPRPVSITGEQAFGHVHRLRAQADAILVGAGTVAADDPQLTCRLPGAAGRSPVRVVLASGLHIPDSAKIVTGAREVPTWILCAGEPDAGRRGALERAGVEVIPVAATAAGRVDPLAALRALAERGIGRVLAEGGGKIARALIDGDLADEVILIEGAGEAEPGGPAAFDDTGPELVRQSDHFVLAEDLALGQDRWRRYEKRN